MLELIQLFLNKCFFKGCSLTSLVHLYVVTLWEKITCGDGRQNLSLCVCFECLCVRAGYKDTFMMHMFIYNTAFSLWMDKKNLPSRLYTLYLYVHMMQYAYFSYTMPLSLHCVYLILIAIIANALHIFCALSGVSIAR